MKCKCDFRTFMVGDGCDVCNPEKALEYARETIDEQAALIEEMGVALEGVFSVYSVSHSPETRKSCWDQVRAALNKWKESK